MSHRNHRNSQLVKSRWIEWTGMFWNVETAQGNKRWPVCGAMQYLRLGAIHDMLIIVYLIIRLTCTCIILRSSSQLCTYCRMLFRTVLHNCLANSCRLVRILYEFCHTDRGWQPDKRLQHGQAGTTTRTIPWHVTCHCTGFKWLAQNIVTLAWSPFRRESCLNCRQIEPEANAWNPVY